MDRIEQDWRQYRLCAKRRWDWLSEKELIQVNGNRDELCAKIRQAYGISTHEAELQIADWAHEQDRSTSREPFESVQSQSQTQH